MKTTEAKKPICKEVKGWKTKGLGYDGEVVVKEKLWRYGYRVKHLNSSSPFDLIVNDKIRVEVKSGKYRVSKTGMVFWNISKPFYLDKCDVVAVVLFRPIEKPSVLFFDKKVFNDLGRSETSVTFSTAKRSRYKLEAGKMSPYDILGNPRQGVEFQVGEDGRHKLKINNAKN